MVYIECGMGGFRVRWTLPAKLLNGHILLGLDLAKRSLLSLSSWHLYRYEIREFTPCQMRERHVLKGEQTQSNGRAFGRLVKQSAMIHTTFYLRVCVCVCLCVCVSEAGISSRWFGLYYVNTFFLFLFIFLSLFFIL